MRNGQLAVDTLLQHVFITLIAFTILAGSFGTIDAGERGVKTRFGAVVNIHEPGFYVKLPLIDKMNKMEVKTRTINYDQNGAEGDALDTSQLAGASKDLQDVWIGVVVNYHIDVEKVAEIYAQYRSVENFESNVIEPIIREVVKSTAAQYTAEELVTKRAEFGDKVNITLAERFISKGTILERFSVTNFEFSSAFTQAIEGKVTAVQMQKQRKINLNKLSLRHSKRLKLQRQLRRRSASRPRR
jgi:regulator of protease activity HflC (stomatin/prohibitin superfamily)